MGRTNQFLLEAADELRRIAPASVKADELLEQAETLDASVGSMSGPAYDASTRR